MSVMQLDPSSGVRGWALTGAVMGIVAGMVFILFELIIAGITGPSAVMPLRAISAVVLGPGALEPSVNVVAAVIIGLIVHFVLAAIFGLIFGMIAWGIRSLTDGVGALVGAAAAYGLVLWIVNFYVIAPRTFPWFTEANPVVQFFAHTVFYGAVLGLLLVGARRAGAGS